MHTLFTNGQSNAEGKREGGILTFSPLLHLWNNRTETDDPTLSLGAAFGPAVSAQNPFYIHPPQPWRLYNNSMIHFGSRLAEALSDDVYQVHSAKGGQSITKWMSTGGTPGPMYIRDKNVILASGIQLPFKIWVRHQGENDSSVYGGNPADLAAAWPHYKAKMIADGIIDSDTVIIFGGLKGRYDDANTVLRQIADNDAQIVFVPLAGIEAGDGVHFDGEQCYNVALEYLEALSAHPGAAYTGILSPIPEPNERLEIGLRSPRTGVSGNDYYNLKFDEIRADTESAYDPATGIWRPSRGRWNVRIHYRPYQMSGQAVVQAVLKRNGGVWRRNESRPNGIGCSCFLDVDVVSTGFDEFQFCAYASTSITYDLESRDADNWIEAQKLA